MQARKGVGWMALDEASALTSARPVPSDEVSEWADEVDVVVIGFGVAGACAAVEAAGRGADVLVLERTSGWGGAAAMAGGFIYLGGGTALQRACGFEDTPEDMYAFLVASMGPGADPAKLAVYSEFSVQHFDWLVSCGVPFRAAFFDRHAWEPWDDEGLMYSGGENAHPWADLVRPAPRGHIPQMADKRTGERGGGFMLMAPLVATAAARGCRVRYDVRFQRLVRQDDGRIVGVVARSGGEQVAVRARRAVVLANGGFTFNGPMVQQHVPILSGRPSSATEEHDGQGIRAAQAVGGDVAHMGEAEMSLRADPGVLVRGIVVDGRGSRITNEDTYPGYVAQAVARSGHVAFAVADERAYDEAIADRSPRTRVPMPRPTWVSDEVSELEDAMGISSGALASTIAEYNRHAAEGRDPVWHKAERWVRPLLPPYGVMDLRGLTSGFPLGGLRTDVDGAVLDVDGVPIVGLRAAGRATSGIAAGGYASGCSLGDGSFFGRRAGAAAAGD